MRTTEQKNKIADTIANLVLQHGSTKYLYDYFFKETGETYDKNNPEHQEILDEVFSGIVVCDNCGAIDVFEGDDCSYCGFDGTGEIKEEEDENYL